MHLVKKAVWGKSILVLKNDVWIYIQAACTTMENEASSSTLHDYLETLEVLKKWNSGLPKAISVLHLDVDLFI